MRIKSYITIYNLPKVPLTIILFYKELKDMQTRFCFLFFFFKRLKENKTWGK